MNPPLKKSMDTYVTTLAALEKRSVFVSVWNTQEKPDKGFVDKMRKVPVWYLNCDDQTERRAQMDAQLSKMNFESCTRVPARKFPKLTEGDQSMRERLLAQNHFDMWRKALADPRTREQGGALFFEDDVFFHNDFLNNLAWCFQRYPSQINSLRLDNVPMTRIADVNEKKAVLYEPTYSWACMGGYYFSFDFIEMILALIDHDPSLREKTKWTTNEQVVRYASEYIGKKGCLSTVPKLVIQNWFVPDLPGCESSVQSKPHMQKLANALYGGYIQAYVDHYDNIIPKKWVHLIKSIPVGKTYKEIKI